MQERVIRTAADLFAAMQYPEPLIVVLPDSIKSSGILQAVEREDGSGRSFNVTLTNGFSDRATTVYVRFK